MEKKRPLIVAVDGPAGSGKSSLCAQVCAKLGWNYFSTGLLYRACAYLAQKEQVDLKNENALLEVVEKLAQGLRWEPAKNEVWVFEEEVSSKLGAAEIGANASFVAKSEKLREKLLPVQRNIAQMGTEGVMLDGRDIGTVVFPNADLKIFLTASVEERAKRRLRQLKDDGKLKDGEDLDAIKSFIKARDEQDSNREIAPLKQADDAILFDNSTMSKIEAVEEMVKIVKEKLY